MNSALHSRLKQSIVGQHLSPANLSALIDMGRAIEAGRDFSLFREGEQNPDIFVLLEGHVELAMTVPGRGACRILTLGPGEIIAWSAVVGNGTMTCSAVCTEDCRLIALDAQLLDALSADDPSFGYQFMKMMAAALSKRLVATRLQMLDLFSAPT
jgi:CRP/FNR family cyclic AMP-dependent transcriptional regulator